MAKKAEKLARKIAGNTRDEIILGHARDAAYAELDLARVRRAKVALIERASALGPLGTPRLFNSAREAERFLNLVVHGKTPTMPNAVGPFATMPAEKFERTTEAIRRVLPELVKLDRYESRAAARRDRAVRHIIKDSNLDDNIFELYKAGLAKRTQFFKVITMACRCGLQECGVAGSTKQDADQPAMVENLTAKAVYFAWGSIGTFLFEASAGSVMRAKNGAKQENPIPFFVRDAAKTGC